MDDFPQPVNARGLDPATLVLALRLMGLNLALQWPSFLYSSSLIALHRQDVLAKLNILTATFQAGGAAMVLWLAGPYVLHFLFWQALGGLIATVAGGYATWHCMPVWAARPRVAPAQLRKVARFAFGTMAIGITTSVLVQADKLVVSKLVPLDRFSAYAVAFALAGQVSGLVVSPISSVVQPLLAGLVAQGDQAVLVREYHKWTQMIWGACLVVPGMLAAFPAPILAAWLGRHSPMLPLLTPILPFVVAGSMLNGVMSMPFMLQMAAGWVRLSLVQNLVALAVVLPALVLLVPRYGVIVGAFLWLGLNLGYLLLAVPIMHRRLLRTELWRWWLRDTLGPAMVAAALFLGSAWLLPAPASVWIGLVQAAVTGGVVGAAMLVVMTLARQDVVRALGVLSSLRARWLG